MLIDLTVVIVVIYLFCFLLVLLVVVIMNCICRPAERKGGREGREGNAQDGWMYLPYLLYSRYSYL